MDFVPGRAQFIGVSAHGGEKQDNLLLVVLFVGAKPDILRHEYGYGARRWQVTKRKQLVAEDNEHQ